MLNLWRAHKARILIGLGILVIGGGIWAIATGGEEVPVDEGIVTAERSDIVQEVSVTGRVEAARTVDLAFERSGRVARVQTEVGQRAGAGQTLVVLQNADVAARLAGARADLDAAEAQLDELMAGPRPEEVQVKESEVVRAETTLAREAQSIIDVIQDAATDADDAIHNKIDQFYTNPDSAFPQIDFMTVREEELEFGRLVAGEKLDELVTLAASTDVSANVEADAATARGLLLSLKSFLDTIASVVNGLQPTSGSGASGSGALTQTDIDGYKADVSAARTNVNASITSLSAAVESHALAGEALRIANDQLDLARLGATAEQIRRQEATVAAAEAVVAQQQAELGKTVLTAPFSGTVTKQEAKVGSIIAANTPIVSMIAPSEFQIEASIPEADIAKVSVGDVARITLDAYSSDVVFNAHVATIDPAETIVEGVATYGVTLVFDGPDERVKSGMTANIDIRTGERTEVIAIPARAVINRDGQQFVRVQTADGTITEVQVETGLRGSLGEVEIRSGIAVGDRVVVFLEE